MNKCVYDKIPKLLKIDLICIIAATIIFCSAPMKINPSWNGQRPEHKNQYEIFTESILRGHIYFDSAIIDKKLLTMNNPYNFEERKRENVEYHWDRAFYKGKYYMYFGIAPVLLTFLPYRVLTGKALTSYLSTQCFVTFTIIGVFALFYSICKYFFRETKFYIYVLSSISFSIISIWFACHQPALYCTAITAGVCMEVWSLYFYFKAVYGDQPFKQSINYAIIGAIFGAVTFACRPPIGLANIIAVPLVIEFFKKHKFNKKTIKSVLLVFIPYIIIAALLMWYNYVRFDNPFEFGQTYQLTIADQQNILKFSSRIKEINVVKALWISFFGDLEYSTKFPFITLTGVFFNFFIFFLPYLLFFWKKFRTFLYKKGIYYVYIALLLLPLFIGFFDIIASPILHERYHMDYYYLMGLATFISMCFICTYKPHNTKYTKTTNIIMISTLGILLVKIGLLFSCLMLNTGAIIERLID